MSDEQFVTQTMLTCLGNKRKLVGEIKNIAQEIASTLGKEKMRIVDGFSGSTVVSRELASLAYDIHCNDMENYAYLMAKCFMEKPSEEQQKEIASHINSMNNLAENGPYVQGIITKLYAPNNTFDIKEGERVFYTRENALIIDTLRSYISMVVPQHLQHYCLVPLLTRASIHANTAGVFKGFYKDGKIGKFGGAGENALERITKPIRLDVPIWSKYDFTASSYNKDINDLIKDLPSEIDLIYLDPPYNQHPYGSNYFMLNVIAENKEPEKISKVSGIPADWQRSAYNSHDSAVESMTQLLKDCLEKSAYVLLSYNDEGIIKKADWDSIFKPYTVEKKEIVYDTYKGSRNLKNRSNKVMEIMYVISR